MKLPPKTLNRLRMGRDVAARIRAERPGHLAWIYVYPLLHPEKGVLLQGHGGEEQIVSTGSGNPIRGFLIRRLEVDQGIAEDHYRGYRDDLGIPAVDSRIEVSSEEELADVVGRWLNDPTDLHVPMDVGYEFEGGPDLIDP